MATRYSPLIVVVGQTASGKSRLAIDLAKKFNGEIISADAWSVRKGLDIGTAKPSSTDLKHAKHHLIDVVEPCEDFTAAVYKRLAEESIADISKRGKLPILVGGTGLYIDAVLFGYSFLKAGSPEERQRLNKLNLEELQQEIAEKGYSLDGIDTRNRRRLIRLIETAGERPKRQELRPNTLMIGLKVPSDELKKRIEKRIDQMVAAGLELEVKRLAKEYGWDCEGLKGIGYSEWQGYFLGLQTFEQTKQKIIKNTLNLAKRQHTWFKRNHSIQWFNDPRQAVDFVTTIVNKF